MKKKICFIGAGKTMEKHLEVFSKFKNLELVGICNRTKRKAHQIKNLKLIEYLIILMKCTH